MNELERKKLIYDGLYKIAKAEASKREIDLEHLENVCNLMDFMKGQIDRLENQVRKKHCLIVY